MCRHLCICVLILYAHFVCWLEAKLLVTVDYRMQYQFEINVDRFEILNKSWNTESFSEYQDNTKSPVISVWSYKQGLVRKTWDL